jgi:hypothetical protein
VIYSGSSAAPINMVFIMPKEFMAPGDEDHEPELEEAHGTVEFGAIASNI